MDSHNLHNLSTSWLQQHVIDAFCSVADAQKWWEKERAGDEYRQDQEKVFCQDYLSFPPITLHDPEIKEECYVLLDGWHRFALALIHSKPYLPAVIWPITRSVKITPESRQDVREIWGFSLS